MAEDGLADVIYSNAPPVCIFADSAAALERMRRSAERAGCRIASCAALGDSAPFDCIPVAAALIEIDGSAPEEALLPLLDWAQREAARGARQIVISAPASLIDLVAARTPHRRVAHLCEASEAERIAAIAAASAQPAARLHDVRRDDGPAILQQLTEDVGRIAAILSSLSEEDTASLLAAKPPSAPKGEDVAPDAPAVRAIIRARRMRERFFLGEIFADPAWDMLLDLMAARIEGKRVAVSSLCIAAAVPATTALRWIKMLTDRGLFVRSADPQDGRRVYIELSDEAAQALAAYLRAVERIGVSVI
ncbi:MAG TPA: winged helix DNA-binding protein [Allosphingosinicella sp.]|nr:winged helix DNA-binding protein [Allosphingosinicella sp.]